MLKLRECEVFREEILSCRSSFLFSSDSAKWLFYGEYNFPCIFAFKEKKELDLFKSFYRKNLEIIEEDHDINEYIWKNAVDAMKHDASNLYEKIKAKFIKNYS